MYFCKSVMLLGKLSLLFSYLINTTAHNLDRYKSSSLTKDLYGDYKITSSVQPYK